MYTDEPSGRGETGRSPGVATGSPAVVSSGCWIRLAGGGGWGS